MSRKPVFNYIIPVYNEEARIVPLLDELLPFIKAYPGSLIVISDNASKDQTVALARSRIRGEEKFVHICEVPTKGQGIAFAQAMSKLTELNVAADSWVVFNAADLPFQFSDALAVEAFGEGFDLVIGSKAHPRSRISRGLVRSVMSAVFRMIRFLLLGMRTKDPQGSVFFRAQYLGLRQKCDAENYFFATQLVYECERQRLQVLEVPIYFRPDPRPSKVNIVKDSLKILGQTWEFARRRGRIAKGRSSIFSSSEALGPEWQSAVGEDKGV
jgi:glycosyltransferase involved in cell wall biosynthesis